MSKKIFVMLKKVCNKMKIVMSFIQAYVQRQDGNKKSRINFDMDTDEDESGKYLHTAMLSSVETSYVVRSCHFVICICHL